jgi:hypothetical protein
MTGEIELSTPRVLKGGIIGFDEAGLFGRSTIAQMSGRPFNNRIEFYGDSRGYYGYIDTSANKQFTTRSLLNWCKFLTNQAFEHDMADVHAVAGILSDQVLANMVANTAVSAGVVVVLCSTNDRNTHDAAWSIANLQAIQALALSRGQILIWLNELPRGGANVLTSTQLKEHFAVARWIMQQATVPGVFVANSLNSVIDPTASDGSPLANNFSDGLHQNGRGAYNIAQSLLSVLGLLFPVRDLRFDSVADAYDATYNPRGILNANPGMTGTGGTVNAPGAGSMSGTLASNYAATLTNGTGLTLTLTGNVSSNGKTWQQIAVTGTPTSAGAKLVIASSAAITSLVAQGDIISQVMEMEVDAGQTGINVPSLEASLNAMNRRDMAAYDVTDLFPNVALAGTQRIGPFTLGAEAAFYKTQFALYFLQNVACSITMRIRGLAARKII